MRKHTFKLLMLVVAFGVGNTTQAAPRTEQVATVINKMNGSPKWVCAISASVTAASCTVKSGTPHIINCGTPTSSGVAYFRADVSTGTVTTSSTNMGKILDAAKDYMFTTTSADTTAFVILSAGTATCNVWELQ